VILYAMTCGCYPFMGKHELDIFLNVKRGRFAVPKYLSEELASLIRTMLNPNPSERPSLNYILNHKWITGRSSTPSHISVVNMYNNKEDFESFAASLERENNDMPYTPTTVNQSPTSAGTSPIINSVADLSLDSAYFVPIENYSPSNLTIPNSTNTNRIRTPSPTSDPNYNVRKRSVSMLQDVYQIQKTFSDPNISYTTNAGASPSMQRSYSNHKSLDLATETPFSEEIILKLMSDEDLDVTENKALSRVASQGRQRANSTHTPTRRLGKNPHINSLKLLLASGRQSRRRSNSTNTPPSNTNRSNIPGFDKIFLPQTAEMTTPPANNPYSPSNLRNSQTAGKNYFYIYIFL
jgi:serine/threonine protein kinase